MEYCFVLLGGVLAIASRPYYQGFPGSIPGGSVLITTLDWGSALSNRCFRVEVFLQGFWCRIPHFGLSFEPIFFIEFPSNFLYLCFIFNNMKRWRILGLGLVKIYLVSHKVYWTYKIVCIYLNDSKENFSTQRVAFKIVLYFERHQDYNLRLKNNGKIRGHSLKLDFRKINRKRTTGERSLKEIRVKFYWRVSRRLVTV